MNGKKPSWLLRAGSFLLAALMVFGNLILPGGIFAASAEDTGTLFSTDFENYVSGVSPYIKDSKWFVTSGGTAVDKTVSVDQVMVEDVNGNNVLAVTSEKDVADIVAGYAFASSQLDDVTLSYNVAFATKGDLWIPTLAHYANTDFVARVGLNGTDNWFMTSPGVDKADGSGKDYYVRNSTGGGFSADALKWYTIKLRYTRDEAGTHAVETYIDGTLTNVQVATSATVGVKTISMLALKKDGCKMYIDNIKVTEGDHAPAAVPTTLYSVNTVFYSDNFDDVALTDGVGSVNSANWQGYTNYSVGIDPDPDAEGNQVMVFADASTKSGLTSIDFGAYKQAVLEYRVYLTDDTVYLPRLSAKNGGEYIFMLHYANGKLAWRQSVNASDQVLLEASEFAPGCWHTIKQAVDTMANKFYLWVDGKLVGSGPLNHTNSITRIVAGAYNSNGDLPTYYDDFAVKAFVPALDFTVSNSTINLAVDESATLKWAFKPVVNSVDEIVFSNSDESVATFDEATGKITALKAGTTTITLDPVQEGLESKTVTVTVTAPVTNQVIYQTGFESTDTEKFAVGDMGFDFAAGGASSKYSNWTLNCKGDETCAAEIQNINGNQVLVLSNNCGAASNANTDADVQVRRNNLGTLSDVWLSYHVAVENTSGVLFFPTLCGAAGESALFGINQGTWTWRETVDGTLKIHSSVNYTDGTSPAVTPKTWYTVEIHYVDGENGGTVEVYIDGKLTDIGCKPKTAMTVNRILVNLDSWGIGETKAYVDNIQVSTQRHTPAAKPAPLTTEEEEETTTVFTEDFESYTAGAMATNDTWAVTGTDGTNNTVKVVELNGNQVLELNNVNGTNVVVSHGLAENYDSLTMTYHVANPTSASTTVFYPSFTNGGSHVACFGMNSGLKYERYDSLKADGTYANKWYPINDEEGNAITLTDLEWHEIKLVYTKSTTGTEAEIELYVDGVKAILPTRFIDKNTTVNGIMMQMSKWTNSDTTLYIDNLCITTDGSNPKVALPEDLKADPLLFETDFEDYTTGNLTVGTSIYSGPTGWNVQNGDAAGTGYGTDITVTVEEINGNKVLAVNKLTSTAKTTDFTLKYKLADKLTSGSAVLSYNVGYSTASMQGWFPNICDQGNTKLTAYMGNNNSNLVYNDGVNTANNGWQPLFAEATKAQALKWYTVQEVYTLAEGENPATVSVYVDGVLTETKVWKNPPADIGGFVVQLYKGSPAGTMYLDNFKLTSGSELHTELTVPASLVAVEKEPEVYYSENFEDETVGKNVLEINPEFKSDWCGTNAPYYTVQNDPVANSTGKVLKINEDSDGNISVANLISATEGKVGRAVLSYKVYPVDGAGNYPITFISSRWSNVLTMLVMSGGTLQYQDTSSTNHTVATMTTNEWHDIKLVTDVTNNRWYLYVDGEFKANIAGFRHDSSANPNIRGVYMSAWGQHNATGICYDDIVVSEYIPIKGFTVDETSLNMVAGTSRNLTVTVDAGKYGSAPNVTFTADDSGVVNVDMFGKVTALKDGTATITVSHPDLPSGSKTVTVTVETKVVTDPIIFYDEDFEDVELTDGLGALPAGLNANDGGYRVSEFVDADGNTHKAVEVYVEEKSTKNLTAFVSMSNTPKTAVLEYDLYFDENVNTMYAMTLRGKELYAAAIKFVLQVDGVFRTNSGVQLAKLSKNEWHHIKLVGDVNTYKWYLWIDGEYIAVEDNSLYTVSGGKISGFSGLCMDTYHASGVFKGIWYDNLKIYEPITTTGLTITGANDVVLTNGSSIALDASKAEEYALKLSFSPENASLKAANFSTNNAAVADVDAFGVIYAKGAGTATITVTPVDPYLPAVELTVTVTGDYVPKPILEEDFQDVTEGTSGPAVVSGSPTAYATVFGKNNGNQLLQVNSNDSTAHGYATIPFLNNNGAQVKYTEKVHLSYWLAASATAGVFYIPGLAANNGGFVGIIAMKNGVFEYTTDGNSWTAIKYKDDGKTALFNADEWYLIEQVYTGGNTCSLTMKINGREVEIKHYNRGYVNCVTMQLTKWMGTMIGYVDNMTVTENIHEPMPKPDGNFKVIPTALKFVDDAGNEISELTIKAQVPTVLNLSFVPLGASDREVTLVSSNTDVVDFNSYGQLIGYENGESVITATLNSNKSIMATITVKVVIEEVTSITVNDVELDAVEGEEDTYTLVVGDHGFATAVAAPENADYKTIMWTSSDPSVATVDSYGEILALSPGTTVIKAASQRDAAVCDTFTVVVTEPGVMKTIQVSSVSELKAALAEVATINAGSGMTGNIEIVLAGGNYYLTETLKLGVEHSGTNGYSVIIKAAENASPVISGASVVTGTWTKVEGKSYYSIQVSKDFNSRQLFVNNVRAVRARSEGGLTNSKFIYDGASINIGYMSSDIELASYKYPEDLELVFKEQWTQPRAGVNYIVDNGNGTVNIVMDQPGWSGVGNSGAQSVTNKGGTSVGNKGPVWYENALELLDASGEWYLDTHTSEEYNILYYMPRPWEDMETAVVTMPTFDNAIDTDTADGALVEISGSFSDDKHNEVDTQVMNIHFEGITFADTTWMRPSTGYGVSDAQNNHIREKGDLLAPGAVLVEAANSIWFTGCTFTRLGINGLQMINGVQNSLIVGNHFYDISGNAINIGEPDTGVANAYAQGLNVMKNDDILNNFIHNIGVDYGSSAAISVGFASDMDMNHNEIFDIPYSGWHIGYGWNNRFPNNNKYMLLEYNFVHDFMDQDIYDGGGIYILGNTSGESYNFAQHNYFRNQMNAHGALYPDQGTTWFKFIENVIDLSEVDSWVSGAPKWSHTNMKTLHLHYINNFSTTDYKSYSNEINFDTDDIQYGKLNVSPDASWDDPIALDVIANAGLESAYDALRNGQVERFEMLVNGTKNTGSEIVLSNGESLKIGYNAYAIREGELVTSGLNYTAYYESQNPEVAEIDAEGNVIAKASGITAIRVWVLSNGIVDVDEFKVVVDDCAESVFLDGVEDTITMSTAVSGWQLKALIRSKLGRELTPDSVSFGIGDTAVATVSKDGLLAPVAKGTTSLTVTATYDGVTVVNVYKVVITVPTGIIESDAGDMFDKDMEQYWVRTNATNWEVVDDTSVTGKLSSYATFGGTKYDNELLCFKLKIDKTGITSDWPSIVLRAQATSGEAQAGATDGYVFCMGSAGIEVYRFIDGIRYVIRGNQEDDGSKIIRLPGAEGVIAPEASGFTYTDSVAEHDMKIGAIADGGNVRILLYVNGVKVLDYLDSAASGAISKSGYFGMIGRGQTFTLTKANYIVPAGAKESNGGDMFDKDMEQYWVRTNATNWEVIDDTSVTGKLSSYATFSGTAYDNELLSFKLKIDKTGITSDWPSIVLRAQASSGEAQAGATDGYVFCMGSAGIEVYRFIDGIRYVIRGNQEDDGSKIIRLPGAEGVIAPETSGFTYTDSVAEHDIKIGAIADGGNIRLLLYVNGVKVLDYLDTAANGAISKPGYFGMIGRGQTFTLTKDTTIADDTGDGEGEDDDVVDTEGKAALIGNVAYDTIEEALAAAQAGDTILLLDDAEVDAVVLGNDVALDLNGNDLTTDYLVIFGNGGITDSSAGVGVLKCENISLPANNPTMPVYDIAVGGYRLFNLVSQHKYRWQKENSFQYIAKPMLNNTANDIFMAQSETNRLTVKLVMSWTTASGNEVVQNFVMSAENLALAYSETRKVIELTVSGAGAYVNSLKTTCYIESDTGVKWMPDGLTYVGE